MTRLSAALAIVVVASLALAAQPPRPPKRRGLFPPLNLGVLEGADREQWNKPDQIMDALKIADGSSVADIGAAGGWFTVRLARRVGPNGVVYAEDIQPEMLEAIRRRLQRENISNVRLVLGTTRDSRLPHGLDAILMNDVYNAVENPIAVLKDAAESIKPQGRIGVVDFTPGAGGPGPEPEQRVDADIVIKGATAAGLHVISREAVPPFMFMVVLGRTAAAQ